MARDISTLNRRRFLAAAVKTGAAVAAPLFIPGPTLGKDGGVAANERITLAAVGIGRRGTYVLGCFMDEPVVQFVAIADIRKDHRQAVKTTTEKKYGRGVATYRDFREMLPRTDIDAVLIATGDRWHTMASIYAAKAGKDIYCEKPCSMTIAESQALADTMRRYGRDLPGRHPAAERTQLRLRRGVVPQRKAGQAQGRPRQYAAPGHQPRLASRSAASRPRKRSTGTCGSVRPPGDRTTGSTSTAAGETSSISTAAASSNGAPTRSTSATGPPATMRNCPCSTSRPASTP